MTPIERAVRALQDELGGNLHETVDDELAAHLFRQAARAVFQAIREPSEGMMSDRVIRAHGYAGDIDMVWQAMIDAAISEKPE